MKSRITSLCVLFLVLTAVCGAGQAQSPQITAGTSVSSLPDPGQAGAEAAQAAKTALGAQTPVLVLVADNMGSLKQEKEALLKGVASVFDAKVIFGCSNFGPITSQSNTGSVGVLALAGPIQLKTAMASGEQSECGRRIGEALIKQDEPLAKGRLLLLMGDCHVPADDALAQGVRKVDASPDKPVFPHIVGGSSPLEGFQYYEGQVQQKSNMGLLLMGDFTVGVSLKNAPDKEGVITSAGQAADEAVKAAGGKANLVFVFDCAARMGQLEGDRPRELQSITQAVGAAPIFGFFGSGEIGHKDNTAPVQGVGVHISVCAIGAAK